jgi:hypothetical protein
MVGAAGCTLKVGEARCTLTVRAAGLGLVRAGGVLGLHPRGLHYALAAWALPSRFALHGHGWGFALTTIK